MFETSDEIPASLQTSPLVSPTGSPRTRSEENFPGSLQEPDYLDLDRSPANGNANEPKSLPILSRSMRASSDLGATKYNTPTMG